MKKVQWRERTDGLRAEGREENGGKSHQFGKVRLPCARQRQRRRQGELLQGREEESIVSFRPNCSAISGVFFCAISPLGDRSAVTKGRAGGDTTGANSETALLPVQSVINIIWNYNQNTEGSLRLQADSAPSTSSEAQREGKLDVCSETHPNGNGDLSFAMNA